jgi:hypothetical protein
MVEGLSKRYEELLQGSYDCVDRVVLNGYHGLCHSGGGFRLWWNRLTGGQLLDRTHLMRMAGHFSRRLRAYAKVHGIPVVNCAAGEEKHRVADKYLEKTTVHQGLFLILVGRAQAPVWDVSAHGHLEWKCPMPFVNHYSFHILDPDWGHVTIKLSGHPPFPAQIILNGHEYVAAQARKAGLEFSKEDNCFTSIVDVAGLGQIADTLSESLAIGRLRQVCERWIYSSCLCFALNLEQQERSGFHYQYSIYQVEYSRNLLFGAGRVLEEVFQALIDRSRGPLDVKKIKTILGHKRGPARRAKRKKRTAWEVTVERPVYDLTVFKVRCSFFTLKIYTKGERVLRVETIAHNVKKLACGCRLERFTEVVRHLQGMLERFMEVLSCLDQCFVGATLLEELPVATQVGQTRVGGIDVNRPRMRWVLQAVLALAPGRSGFTASQLAQRVREFSQQSELQYGARHAAYDLKKLRGKQMVHRMKNTRRYEAMREGLRAMAALLVLRDKVLRPLLAAAQPLEPSRGAHNPTALDRHYEVIRNGMQGVFQELGLVA